MFHQSDKTAPLSLFTIGAWRLLDATFLISSFLKWQPQIKSFKIAEPQHIQSSVYIVWSEIFLWHQVVLGVRSAPHTYTVPCRKHCLRGYNAFVGLMSAWSFSTLSVLVLQAEATPSLFIKVTKCDFAHLQERGRAPQNGLTSARE